MMMDASMLTTEKRLRRKGESLEGEHQAGHEISKTIKHQDGSIRS